MPGQRTHGAGPGPGCLPGGGCLLGGWIAGGVWAGFRAGGGGDDGGALDVGGRILGEREDVPGDVGTGDGLYGDPVAGLDAPGERAIGELDGPWRIPVEPARGEFLFHRAEVLA